MARLEKDQRRAAELLDAIEKLMQVCKTEHEMYFMGILRRPPEEKAQELVRQFHELENTTITNTALGFKAKVLRTRHNGLRLIWVRTLKQIEDGTYKRHRFMADVRDKERQNSRKKEDPEVVKAEVRALARGQDPEKAKAEARRKLALARGEPDPATLVAPAVAVPAAQAAPAAPTAHTRAVPEGTRRPAAAVEGDDDDLFDAVLGARPQGPALRPTAPLPKDDDEDLFDAVLGVNPKKQSLPPAPPRATAAKAPPPVPASVASDDDDAIFDAALSGHRPAMKSAAPKPAPRPTAPSPDPSRAADAIMRTTGSMRAVPSPHGGRAPQPSAGHEVGTESLYREYQSARRNAGEAGGGLSADALKSTLAKQREQIKAQYGVADVRFRVVVEDGKSKVKAIPIK